MAQRPAIRLMPFIFGIKRIQPTARSAGMPMSIRKHAHSGHPTLQRTPRAHISRSMVRTQGGQPTNDEPASHPALLCIPPVCNQLQRSGNVTYSLCCDITLAQHSQASAYNQHHTSHVQCHCTRAARRGKLGTIGVLDTHLKCAVLVNGVLIIAVPKLRSLLPVVRNTVNLSLFDRLILQVSVCIGEIDGNHNGLIEF